MLDDDGHVLKLLEAKSHKECLEEVFYEHVFKKEPRNEEWRTLKDFLPFYYGKISLTHLGKNLEYLKMEDLTKNLEKPCIIDIKIGKKTFDPFADPQKVERELIRYKYQAQLGFRVTGFKLFKAKTNETELFDRFYCKGIQPQDITRTFSYFFDIQSFPERRYLVKEVINKLKQLLQWFEKQKRIKFFRTSLLIAYDGSQKITEKKAWQKQEHFATDANGSKSFELGEIYQIEKKANANFHFQNVGIHDFPPASLLGSHRKSNLEMGEECIGREKCVVKMIDFAHTFCDLEEMSDCIDENYIYGLKSLINEIEKCLGNGF
ncbi:inositol polyphosphate multikinase-like isoform X2 [Rhopilema esculentum]